MDQCATDVFAPPGWLPNTTFTGSDSSGVRSTTAVSNTNTEVLTTSIPASTVANTLGYTIDGAIDPPSSVHSTKSAATVLAPEPVSVYGMIVR